MVRVSWSVLAVAAAAVMAAAPASAQKNWLSVDDPSVTQQPTINERRTEPLAQTRESMDAKEHGLVTATMCVNDKGVVSDVELVETTEFKRLNDTTRRWLMKVRMHPAEVDGKAVAVCGVKYEQNWGEVTARDIREMEQRQRGN